MLELLRCNTRTAKNVGAGIYADYDKQCGYKERRFGLARYAHTSHIIFSRSPNGAGGAGVMCRDVPGTVNDLCKSCLQRQPRVLLHARSWSARHGN